MVEAALHVGLVKRVKSGLANVLSVPHFFFFSCSHFAHPDLVVYFTSTIPFPFGIAVHHSMRRFEPSEREENKREKKKSSPSTQTGSRSHRFENR